jgi:hypothetical protein
MLIIKELLWCSPRHRIEILGEYKLIHHSFQINPLGSLTSLMYFERHGKPCQSIVVNSSV